MTITPRTAAPAAKFIDISSNNFGGGKTIDFDAYWRAGYRWLFVKRSEGVGYTWNDGAAIIDAWHKRGGHVGHYHWLRPDADATAQANYFLGVLNSAGKPVAGDVLMTDFEASYNYSTGAQVSDGNDTQRAAALLAFNTRVTTQQPNHELLIYTGNWYLERFGPAVLAAVKQHRVVLSEYTGADAPDNRFGLHVAAYQFTDRASVPGVSAPVDCNVWLADPSQSGKDWFDMASKDDLRAVIRDELNKGVPGPDGHVRPLWRYVIWPRGYRAMARRQADNGKATK